MTLGHRLVDAAQQRHLYYFVCGSFDAVHPGQTFIRAWHVEAMCRQLEKVATGEVLRLLITVPPRHLKSVCTAVCFPAWLLGRDPKLKIMVASYGQELAVKHARDFRGLIESPRYQGLSPATQIHPRRNTDAEIMTTMMGGRKAVSLAGPVTGFGADVIIVDDLLKTVDAPSEIERQRLKDFFEQTLISRLNDKRTGRIIVIQQRVHEDDLAGYLIDKGNFVHLNLRAIAEEDETFELTQGRRFIRRKGEALFPEREPLSTLEEIRREIGSFAFSAQYQQNPVPPEGNRIRWEWFGVYEERPPRTKLQLVVQSWDTAVTAEPTSDFSVCTSWGYCEGVWHLLDVYRERLEYPALKRKVIELRDSWRAERVVIERATTGIPLVQELRREGHRNVVGMNPTRDKETRLAAQAGKLEAGKVLIPVAADWLPQFKHELLAFPNGRHDDQVDSMAQFLEWSDSVRGRGWRERQLNGGRPPGRRRRPGRRRAA